MTNTTTPTRADEKTARADLDAAFKVVEELEAIKGNILWEKRSANVIARALTAARAQGWDECVEACAVMAEKQSSHQPLENDLCCTVAEQIAEHIRALKGQAPK